MKDWIIFGDSLAVLIGAIILIVLLKIKHRYADQALKIMISFTAFSIILVLWAWFGLKS